MRVKYDDFKRYFLKYYTEDEVKYLFGRFKHMDRECRSWMCSWFYSGRYPDVEIEGVTLRELVDECGLMPLNAFIVLNWLKKDPEEAKFYLLKLNNGMKFDREAIEEMKAVLNQSGETFVSEPEDFECSDAIEDD